MKKILCLSALCFLASLICNDIEDTLVHHYSESIFDQGFESFWNPEWARVEWYREYTSLPSYTYDGWHLVKIIRQLFLGLGIYLVWLGTYENPRGYPRRVATYHRIITLILWLIVWGCVIYLSHWLLYGNLFYK